jgi:hemolysin D|tara:strand:+ start:761 stop:2176 length:1416 start_codon:yes stop_codon:yes gene_type:complete
MSIEPPLDGSAGTGDSRRSFLGWLRGLSANNTDSVEFLPAALAVQTTPPSPAARWITWLLVGFFTIGVLWAYFGHVDIVVTAPGRIIPSGHVKVVQAPEAGVITIIPVRNGQYVKKGEVVIELDTTFASADDERLQQSMADTAMHQSWRNALDDWLAELPNAESVPDPIKPVHTALSPTAKRLLFHHQSEVVSRLQELLEESAALDAELRGSLAEEQRTAAVLRVLDERVTVFESLLDKQYAPKAQYLEIKQQQVELERTLPLLQERKLKLEKQIMGIDARRSTMLAEYKKSNLLEMSRLEMERRAVYQDLLKAQRRHMQHKLKAPVSGTVQQLIVHTVGGVVSPSQELLKIVPNEAVVEVQALVRNKDIGFLVEGQRASVKIDTFNFTKYGYIDAEVVDISEDAVEDAELGWVFEMNLALNSDQIQVGERSVRLTPGMSVMAEIKTGQRRIIEFFLSPLLRYKEEGIRER